MKRFSWVLFIMFALGYFSQSEASLIDRGNGLIYIDFLDLTWLQDANYAFTSGYDADGKMFWGEANNWANNLVYNGISGWRLPGKVEGHTGLEITSSEMGYLYLYKNLNNQGEILDTGPFINLQHHRRIG